MSKTALCYFTGTGNSLYAAQSIAKWIRGCELFAVRDLIRRPQMLDAYERVGFFFPVYGMGLPHYIGRLATALEDLDLEGRYLFSILTHGGVPGNAQAQLYRLFLDAGVRLSYINLLLMPKNFTLLYKAPSKDSIERTLLAADKRLSQMAADISAGIVREPRINAKFLDTFNEVFLSDGGERDERFILTAACNGCGQCVGFCPVANISMWQDRPMFHHRCELCLGCFHRCPQGAINVGRKTIEKRRYVNPRVF